MILIYLSSVGFQATEVLLNLKTILTCFDMDSFSNCYKEFISLFRVESTPKIDL